MAFTDPFDVSADGIIEPEVITVKHTTLTKGTHEGWPVGFSANMTVAPCADGDEIEAVAITIQKDSAGVAIVGSFTMPYTGITPPVPGFNKFLANGTGGVKVDAAGQRVLVLSVDTTALTVQFILDNM